MATPTFPKLKFSPIKASLVDRVGAHVKNAGPQSNFRFFELLSSNSSLDLVKNLHIQDLIESH